MRFPFVAVILLITFISCSLATAPLIDSGTLNTKEFISTNYLGNITIKNEIGQTLDTASLDTSTGTCFGECSSKGLRCLKAKGKLFDGIEFVDISKVKSSVVAFPYIVSNEVIQVNADTFVEQCGINKNGTYNCLNIKNGTHKENKTIEVYTRYNYSDLDIGCYVYSINGTKEIDSSVEWYAYIRGIKTTEWAPWVSGELAYYNQPYYQLNNTVTDETGYQDWTNAAGGQISYTTGKIGNAVNVTGFQISGAANVLKIPSTNGMFEYSTGNFEYDFWIKAQAGRILNNKPIMTGYPNKWTLGFSDGSCPADDFYLGTGGSGAVCANVPTDIFNNSWRYIIVQRNSGNMEVYVDNVSINFTDSTIFANNLSTSQYVGIGTDDTAGGSMFEMDMLSFRNRTLNETERSRLWNNGNGLAYPFTISNTAPVVSINSILPTTAYTNNDLNCSFIATDADNNPLSANITWYKDNIMQFSFNISINAGNTTSNILKSANTSVGQVWNCSVTAYDGTAYSVANSTTRTISNSRPVAVVNPIQPLTASASDDLNCSFSVSDDDGDSLASVVSWYKDDALQMAFNIDVSLGYNSNILKAGNTTKGEVWNCTVVAYDGALYSYEVNAVRTIGNTAPALPELQFTPSIIYNDTSFYCKAQVTDIDFDNVTAFFNLTVGGWYVAQNIQYDIISGSIISWLVNETYYETGENVTCMLHVNDGTSDSATKEKSFIVSALPPADAWETTSGALWLGILFIAWVIMLLFSVWLLRTAFNMGSFIMGVLGMALGLLTAYNVPAALAELFNNDVLIRIIIVAFFMLIFILIMVNSKKGNGSEM